MLLLLTGSDRVYSQGVGINTITPDPSAALHIQSTNKGVLLPKVSLQSGVDNTSISNPANALLIYNTNTNLAHGIGLYYNRGTPMSPNWESVSQLKFPYFQGGSEQSKPLFDISNYYGQVNAVAIKGYAFGAGTGIYAKSDNGSALKVEGGLRIFGNGQSPGAGKVLTSNSFGDATWEGPVAFSVSGIKGGGGEVAPPGAEYVVPFTNENYDTHGAYQLHNQSPASTFVAPANGIYHFDAQIANGGDFVLLLKRIRNGNTTTLSRTGTTNLSGDFQLMAQDQVVVVVFAQDNHLFMPVFDDNSYFMCHMIK